MFKVKMIADYISVGIVGLICYPFIRFFETMNIFYLYFGIALIGIEQSTKIIKHFTKDLGPIFLRPASASNCDILCRDGSGENKPGFPSGHATVAAFVMTVIYLMSPSLSTAISCITIIAATGWARHVKHCHNLVQICTGTLYGVVGALFFFRLASP